MKPHSFPTGGYKRVPQNVSPEKLMARLDAECQVKFHKNHQKGGNSSWATLELGLGILTLTNINARNLQFEQTRWKGMFSMLKQWNGNRKHGCLWNSETPFSRAGYTELLSLGDHFYCKSLGVHVVVSHRRWVPGQNSGFYTCIPDPPHRDWHMACVEYMFVEWMNVCLRKRC